MAYPATFDSYSAIAGTSTLAAVDHANLHNVVGSAVVAIETAMGTTAGTNITKNFAAGDFPARINASNVLQQPLSGTFTITGGTLANGLVGTSNVTGGTVTSLIGTSQITGGTVTSAVMTSNTIGTTNKMKFTLGSAFATATGTVGAGTTVIPGCAATITPSYDSYALVFGAADVQNNVAADISTIIMRKDGVNQTNQMVFQNDGVNDRLSCSNTWIIPFTGGVAGTLDFIIIRSAGSGTCSAYTPHTGFTYFLVAQ
jgi:hypothetical protein